MRRLDEFSEYVYHTGQLVENLERKIVDLRAENSRLRKKVRLAQYTLPFVLGAFTGACLVVIFW